MREKDIEKKVCAFVTQQGGIAYKFTSPQRRSVPDRLIVLPGGVPFFIEFKKPGGRLTSGQEREIKRLKDLGQNVYVIDNVESGVWTVKMEAQNGAIRPRQTGQDRDKRGELLPLHL